MLTMERNMIRVLCSITCVRIRVMHMALMLLTAVTCLTLVSLIYFHNTLLSRKDVILVVVNGIMQNGMREELKTLEFDFDTSDEYFRNERNANGIDCNTFIGDKQTSEITIELFGDRTLPDNCTALTTGYIKSPLTELEASFPIAYSILMFQDAAQVWTLLQAIYRPQNLYCIHIDQKSAPEVWSAMGNLVRCLDNVFFSSRSVDVSWGNYSVLEPELICMEDLYKRSTTWRYFINLTGQEFPLKTNFELVKILTAYDGANDVEGVVRRKPNLWVEAGDAPDDLIPIKGAVHVAVNRKFVEFVLTEAAAKRLLTWSSKVMVPDEVFFNTLNFNPKLRIPGSFWSDKASLIESKPYLARYKQWKVEKYYPNEKPSECAGKYVRDICILELGDMHRLSVSKAMFANKFHWKGRSKVAEYCQAEVIYNRTKEEYFGKITFDDTYYRHLDFVQHQLI